MNLTPKQLEVVRMVAEGIARDGYPPTMQEMADRLQRSKVTVFESIEACIRKGFLVKDANKSRGLSLAPGVTVPGGNGRAVDQLITAARDYIDISRRTRWGASEPEATEASAVDLEEAIAAVEKARSN